jgi:hypothetical protein
VDEESPVQAVLNLVKLNRFPLFLLTQKAQKKKLSKKKMPEREFRLCGGDQGSAFGNRKLLKKFDQNFPDVTTIN